MKEFIVQPLIGMIFGSTEGLKSLFLIIPAIIFFGFKLLRLEKLDKKDC
jgi:hypothetical protein